MCDLMRVKSQRNSKNCIGAPKERLMTVAIVEQATPQCALCCGWWANVVLSAISHCLIKTVQNIVRCVKLRQWRARAVPARLTVEGAMRGGLYGSNNHNTSNNALMPVLTMLAEVAIGVSAAEQQPTLMPLPGAC
jgi:hypothetical protein